MHGGPYAILVREVAEHTKAVGQHDYLGMPEIIEDLCQEIQASAAWNCFQHSRGAGGQPS